MPDSNQPAATAKTRLPRVEMLAVFSLLAAILILNLITATRFPVVWTDEAMYTDPAANLALGKGFTSSAWYDQTSERFWAANVPLHEIVLSGWIRLFGFSATAVRAINYVWFGLGTFLVWLACARSGWIKNSRLRLLSLVLLACSSSVSFSYRSGRPDMICYFLFAAALCAASIRLAGLRYGLLLGLGFLFPWAGMQILPLLVIATGLILVFWGWRAALNGIVAGLGAGLGLLGLYVFYQNHGVWQDFVASIARHQSGAVGNYAHGQISALPAVFLRDRSAPFLILSGIVLLLCAWKNRNTPALKILLFALAAGIGIPTTLHFTGVFPIYYGWMAALPVTLALCHGMSCQRISSFWLKSMVLLLLVGAIGIGFPARFAFAMLSFKGTSYPAMEQFVSGHLNAADNVYIDFTAFYPARRSANKIFTPRYLEYAMMTADEKKSVTALVIVPRDLPSVTNAIPGHWQLEAEYHEDASAPNKPTFLAKQKRVAYAPYELAVYRRVPENLPAIAR